MATDEDTQNPFTRPGFVAAAVVVALVVVLGLTIAIINATRAESTPDSEPAPTSAPATVAPTATTDDARSASICNLADGSDTIPVSAPEALWEYQDTTGYPTSKTYGPGKEDPAGFRYCFQHSPTGALFAAANAAVHGSSNSDVVGDWLEYFIAPGPYRQDVLSQGAGNSPNTGVRLHLEGFRVLSYDHDAARVDIAVRGVTGAQTVHLSMVYSLVWVGGDWKLDVSDPTAPIDVANIPDVGGYIPWGE